VKEPMVQPWERQPGETAKAFAAFRVYRSLDTSKRSLEAVAAKARTGPKTGHGIPGYIKDWSVGNNWVKRAAAYDDHLDEVRRRADERAIVEMSKKHAEGMRKIFDRGLGRINALDDEDLRGNLALELAVQGMKGERLARGLTTDSVRQVVQGELNVRHNDGIADSILADPEATRFLCLALERASARSGKPGVVRNGGVEGAVEDAEAPEPTER